MQTIAVPVRAEYPELGQLVQDIEKRAFERFASRGFGSGRALDDWLAAEREVTFVPPAEVIETGTEFKVDVAVPGVPAASLMVDVTPHCVMVEGETRSKKPGEDERPILSEICGRKLFRKIDLPGQIDVHHVTARLDSGMLRITARKAAP